MRTCGVGLSAGGTKCAAATCRAAGTLTGDQRLLRVLLNDDRAAFEQALEERLVARRESVGADPAARSLLPAGAVTLTALACLAHGCRQSGDRLRRRLCALTHRLRPRPATTASGGGAAFLGAGVGEGRLQPRACS
ncbi:Imm49 family immunity protein [Streptomyces sp. NPDC002698]|uniref:Imm49 family immunity protein n=1 Tax=Streptomyces sp. NPDC002698 TaxID=3364660 RepID=UPI00369F51D9